MAETVEYEYGHEENHEPIAEYEPLPEEYEGIPANATDQQVDEQAYVTNPPHYAGDGYVDCMRAMESMLAGDAPDVTHIETYWQASVLKYLWRYSRKNGLQDLEKAQRCIEYLMHAYLMRGGGYDQ